MKTSSSSPFTSPSRRQFLGQLALGATALALAPRAWAQVGATPKKLGVALVGLGGYSTGQLGPALRHTEFCRLAGVVTGSPEKGRQWAQDYGFSEKNIYGYDTMDRLADNPEIDIVYVVTPNALHAEHCIAAAKAGKHVISEKPFTTTVAEAEAVLAVFRETQIRHSIGYRLHFDPYHEELRRLAREKPFGEFTKVTGGFSFMMPKKVWRADKKMAGGGPVMDLGIYFIQGACMAANGVAPVAVTAKTGPVTRPDIFTDVEETMTFTLEFANGMVAEGTTSYEGRLGRLRAEAAQGWIDLQNAFAYNGIRGATSAKPLSFVPPVNQQALQMDDFAQCVRQKKPTRVPGEMGLRDMKIIAAIYESAANGGKRVAVKA
jgi:glucose-fructose oxidoreductase